MDLEIIYENMRSKFGWSDGEAEPSGSYQARDNIVKLINANLPSSCNVEAYGFDRPGMHNGALILYRMKGSCNVENLDEPQEVPEILYDAMEQGIATVNIELTVSLTKGNLKIKRRKTFEQHAPAS